MRRLRITRHGRSTSLRRKAPGRLRALFQRNDPPAAPPRGAVSGSTAAGADLQTVHRKSSNSGAEIVVKTLTGEWLRS